ncbi:hypothetical protein CTAM01_15707 [Colletotrichum tamarilloi]|uniref:Uncharacterized protein n=1 Tax=Colletotrichum tamarilloi TaxID=1209934 RepID=A0ABQ9QKJ3_9PEZI|nr:uncharacterized protein CTAM01_15707 [Colletotrichum tamarilloi]KAK1475138.1 hypothetical protein CTAM01_15707 [Colletotrichum tamarilloi]
MQITVNKGCWRRWADVIRHLAREYGFPAKTRSELELFLSMYRGKGSTYRTSTTHWRFIIDVTRDDKAIVNIIAITIIARHKQDENNNGAVITRACDVHPDPEGGEYVGAPHLRWITVKSGGETYRHCCDKECSGPEQLVAKTRANWETTRLRVIQKAYEQEVLASYASFQILQMEKQELTETLEGKDLDGSLSDLQMKIQQLETDLIANKQVAKKYKDSAKKRKMELAESAKQVESLRQALEAVEAENKTLATVKNELALAVDANRRTKEALQSDMKDLHESNATLKEQNAEMGRTALNLQTKVTRLSSEKQQVGEEVTKLEREMRTREESLAVARKALTQAKEELKDTKKVLQSVSDEAAAAASRTRSFAQLRTQTANLEESTAEPSGNKPTMKWTPSHEYIRVKFILEKTQKDLAERIGAHTTEIRQFKEELKQKNEFIGHIQDEMADLQRTQGSMSSHRQPEIKHEPQDVDPMNLDTEAMKFELETEKTKASIQMAETAAEKAEVKALAKKCADRMKAAEAKEAYTANMEKQLEEMRGAMEGMLGRVSVYQGKKRRRTEGPDFQL